MSTKPKKIDKSTAFEVRPEQSVDLLKALHILTPDGKMNQDSRRKLKQVYHLFRFIEPLLAQVWANKGHLTVVDHGAGKSYLGFILYDLFFKPQQLPASRAMIYGIETRSELVKTSQHLAQQAGFDGMAFLNLSVAESSTSAELPTQIDVVTALHACDTATDDAIAFALTKNAQHIVLVPCCQAEVASVLRKNKNPSSPISEMWRHPIHTREFGSQITNVLRCLQLQAHGYNVTVTELVGWEHSMKNELIIATRKNSGDKKAAERLNEVLAATGLDDMRARFFVATS